MPQFTLPDGTRLAYGDAGTGLAVLCLPGLTRTMADFDYLAPHLPPLRLIRMDYRGRGGSDWTGAASYSVPQEAKDALALLDHLGVARAAILGASRGGMNGGYGFAYCSALITSMPTNRSFPSTHASCPGGIVYESPATMFFCVPSFIRTVRHPETAYPTCEAWQDSVLTTGFMHSDQRQPGSRFKRLRVNPSKRTTSTRVLFGVRTSSGDWCDFTSNFAAATGVVMTLLLVCA